MFTKKLYLRSVSFKVIALGRHGLERRLYFYSYYTDRKHVRDWPGVSMYGLALFLLRNFCFVLGLFRRLCFYVFLNACRSNRLLAGMGWRADYHYSYIRPATHQRLAWCFLSDSPFVFVLGVGARPWWGLPQSVAVGVICPHLIFS